MRQLVYFGEDEVDVMVAEENFRHMPEADRDAVIAAARASETWNRMDVFDDES